MGRSETQVRSKRDIVTNDGIFFFKNCYRTLEPVGSARGGYTEKLTYSKVRCKKIEETRIGFYGQVGSQGSL